MCLCRGQLTGVDYIQSWFWCLGPVGILNTIRSSCISVVLHYKQTSSRLCPTLNYILFISSCSLGHLGLETFLNSSMSEAFYSSSPRRLSDPNLHWAAKPKPLSQTEPLSVRLEARHLLRAWATAAGTNRTRPIPARRHVRQNKREAEAETKPTALRWSAAASLARS